jgi:TonB family protein
MSIGQRLVGIAILATSSVVFAQTAETKPPDVGSSGSTNSQSSATSSPNPCESGHSGAGQAGDYGLTRGRGGEKAADQLEILTDTMGVDFGPYLKQIAQIVRKKWYNQMPPSIFAPLFKQGKVSIEFSILKDGKTTGMVVHTSSGDAALDRAAWGSITASTPFPPLPEEFPGEILGLRFYYFYNLRPTGIGISISPCGDVQVPAGSTQQFSASGKALTDAWVDWSVSGSGCSKSACGTISGTGLYTAPVDIPSPPTVIVEAKSWTNGPVPTVKATSRVNVSITGKSR